MVLPPFVHSRHVQGDGKESDMARNSTPWAEVKAGLLANPETKAAYDALAPGYELARLRIAKGLTREQVAARAGMKEAKVARVETGRRSATLDALCRVAEALGYRVEVRFVAVEADKAD